MTAAISGGAGDLVYSIPIMRQLGVRKYYVKTNYYLSGNLYETSKRLLKSQGFEVEPTSGNYEVGKFDPALSYDVNIDDFRKQRNRGRNHIMLSMARQFGTEVHPDPWMEIDEPKPGDLPDSYTLVHVTPRWREGSAVNWGRVLQGIDGPVYFLGFQEEFVQFSGRYGTIKWLPTEDLYEMAVVIKHARALYCNQSVALTLAQGLGKDYYLERRPHKTNTLLYTPNEHIL